MQLLLPMIPCCWCECPETLELLGAEAHKVQLDFTIQDVASTKEDNIAKDSVISCAFTFSSHCSELFCDCSCGDKCFEFLHEKNPADIQMVLLPLPYRTSSHAASVQHLSKSTSFQLLIPDEMRVCDQTKAAETFDLYLHIQTQHPDKSNTK